MEQLAPTIRVAVLGLGLLLTAAGPSSAQCDCGYQEPCTITTNIADFVSASDHTTCIVQTTTGLGSVAYTVTTPHGEQYRIENPFLLFDGWFINADAGVRVETGDATHPCYRTRSLQICLGQ
jgi:hypothetical protein